MRLQTVFSSLLLFVMASISTMKTQAQCISPFENGRWVNMDANTGSITRVQVNFCCNDVISCGVDANGNVTCTPACAAPYSIHLWGKCHPSDCDWGAVNGTDYYTSGGVKWVYFFYNHGFAKRYVYIKPSSLYPGYLYMWMYTDFTDPNRPDYVSTNWFHR